MDSDLFVNDRQASDSQSTNSIISSSFNNPRK